MNLDLNFTAFWVSFLIASIAWTHAVGSVPMQAIGVIASLSTLITAAIQYANQD